MPLRAGVAVNSTMHAGRTSPSAAKERSVRALCASSTITIGRRKRSMFTSDGFGLPSAPGNKSASRSAGTFSRCSAKLPFCSYTFRPVGSLTRNAWIVATITTVCPSTAARDSRNASSIVTTSTALPHASSSARRYECRGSRSASAVWSRIVWLGTSHSTTARSARSRSVMARPAAWQASNVFPPPVGTRRQT